MPNYKFSVQEKVELVKFHYQGLSYRENQARFAVTHPDRPTPSLPTIRNLVLKFEQSGSVDERTRKISQPNRQLSWDTKLDICLTVEEDPFKPISRIAQDVEISNASVRRVLREAKYRSYKFQVHQELLAGDNDSRLRFSQELMERLNADEGLLSRICFSDESTVILVGKPNRQNTRAWCRNNPRLFIQAGTQYPLKLNVWLGAIGNRLIGPFFIDGNLNGEKYLWLLRERIVPALRLIEEEIGEPVWFQQDGAPPHFTRAVRDYLDQQFPGRWIGRGSPEVEWPARSPDLAPLDYGLWGHLKNVLYAQGRIEDLAALQARILDILQNLSPDIISNTTNAFYDRLGYCAAAAGGHFEHFLKGNQWPDEG
ncbi:uncharacterized protein LOC124186678 [Neodiprion fabricii]|uniref:uncharacterized protein LOC124186678 n=1 Tax=Neodiprion fabricii TaxID=2872261 RepID=UPI001ED92046|nr:uncharacterized protein LOC124186678 [Neodiprion fabricii]